MANGGNKRLLLVHDDGGDGVPRLLYVPAWQEHAYGGVQPLRLFDGCFVVCYDAQPCH